MIPRIIHFVWLGAFPQWVCDNLDAWESLNWDYEIVIHTDDKRLDPRLRNAYDSTDDLAQKSDLIRYSVLNHFGGWYFDCDFVPIRPLDDAVRGFGLDGKTIFVSEQQGHRSGSNAPYANAPLACQRGMMEPIIDAASKVKNQHRCSYGPSLVKEVINSNKSLFTIGEAGWFFPLSINDMKTAGAYLHSDRLILNQSGTAGHMPIAIHQWASSVNPETYTNVDSKPLVIVQSQIKEQALNCFAQGLESIGCTVVREQSLTRIGPIKPDLLVCWNGRRDKSWFSMATKHNIPILYVEYGFFQRGTHVQVDRAGILQWASWANDVHAPATDAAHARLRLFADARPVKARSDGDILILGQVDGDTQNEGSEVAGHAPLLRHISRALPDGVRAVFRPHPQNTRSSNAQWFNIDVAERDGDYSTKQARDLPEALSRARFCISINSNGLVEATIAGVPCLAFGPSLGLNAGAYRQATVATLASDIKAMLDGWEPPPGRSEHYLAHLASHQYSHDELRDASVVHALLRNNGITLRDNHGKPI